MAKVVPTERFVKDLTKVSSERVYEAIRRSVTLLEDLPEIGSREIPLSIALEFGGDIRKVFVRPFDVFYEYSAETETDTVTLEAVIHCRQAR